MKKKKVLIIDNGGTVSMKREEGALCPVDGKEDIRNLIFKIKRPVGLHYLRTNKIDSANMSPELMKSIYTAVAENYEDYDGFVVLTGTDTLAYLASFLSFWLLNIKKPVVITGAQKPLNELGSDAPGNIYYSIMFACEEIPEVVVFFGKHLFRGNRVRKIDSRGFEAFDSPNFLPLGHVDALHHRIHSPLESLFHSGGREYFNPACSDESALILIHPGMRPEILDFYTEKKYRGIILEAYGMGNMPMEGEYSLLSPVERALKGGIGIFIISQCSRGSAQPEYDTALQFTNLGAVHMGDMTREACFAKLSWLLGRINDIEIVKKEMVKPLCGEMLPVEQEQSWRIDY